ncbi:MAG: helix-hairpin-helix repeat-containing competence protein ComEA [Chloroflexi bacterium OLB14]|nr:MAG: helix-hairpin-helix repeat-containing competence protein ComEA [Chloroflexi bacterium OLB14]
MKNVLTVLIGVIAGFALAGVLFFVARAPAGEAIVLQPAPTKSPIAVHVIGAVPRPGLYEFVEGARVQDAIDAAGGLLSSANVDSINLAALLEDGQQLNIPYKAGEESTQGLSTAESPILPTEASPTNSGNESTELININTATVEELDSLPGIGPTIAQRIVAYRNENGPFNTIEDIQNVSGVGPSTFEEIKDLITV